MNSYTAILYQAIIVTKYRKPCMLKETRPILYNYIYGILKEKDCKVYRINGIEDHLHIIFKLHPSVALATLMREIKVATNKMIHADGIFPDFERWQPGYAAFSYAQEALPNLVSYVKRQEIHHRKETAKFELQRMLREENVEYDERYLI